MKKTLKARPTEYRGIVYKSKCEAMFARYLELSVPDTLRTYARYNREPNYQSVTPNHCGYVYEPAGFEVGDWVPDFVAFWSLMPNTNFQLPSMIYEVIEYKPSKPTETYLDEFSARVLAVQALLRQMIGKAEVMAKYYLYWGSVFSESSGIVSARDLEWQHLDCEPWLVPEYAQAIRDTRFDLEVK